MVLREDQEKATYTQKVDFAKLRSELMTADSTESSLTRASHERLTNELAKLNSRLRDEIQRTQASVRLDLNLEKGRIREEANVQELKLKETETRIEQETAQLRERLGRQILNATVADGSLHWYCGVDVGCVAVVNVKHDAMAVMKLLQRATKAPVYSHGPAPRHKCATIPVNAVHGCNGRRAPWQPCTMR